MTIDRKALAEKMKQQELMKVENSSGGIAVHVQKPQTLRGKLLEVADVLGFTVKHDANVDAESRSGRSIRYTYTSATQLAIAIGRELKKQNVYYNAQPRIIVELSSFHEVIVETKIEFCDLDTGETLVGIGQGSGSDPGDKAIMKAQTASKKYALLNACMTATGDDPEADRAGDDGYQDHAQNDKAKELIKKAEAFEAKVKPELLKMAAKDSDVSIEDWLVAYVQECAECCEREEVQGNVGARVWGLLLAAASAQGINAANFREMYRKHKEQSKRYS